MHRLLARQIRKLGIVATPNAEQWAALLERVDRAYTEADQDRYTLERALELSSAEMRKRYGELRDAQRALVEASRKVGMADVAASVLHNVGNVLNSANVSTRVLVDCVEKSSRSRLGKALTLLASQPKPGVFIDEDPRGQKLLPYLAAVHEKLEAEAERMRAELDALSKNIDHIKAVVGDQLSSARDRHQSLVLERAPLDELVRDAVELSELASRPEVNVVFDLESFMVEIDRHKLTQIVINLLRNAYDAVLATGEPGTITLKAYRESECRAVVEVRDTGVGLEKKMTHEIFNHGFTTKKDGNGFGLHHSACTAIELGAVLKCASEGLGHGATFTLTFPRKRGASRASCAHLSAVPAAPEGLAT